MAVATNAARALAGRALRILGFGALAGAGLWWGRMVAHSKVPPPEGRWREVSLERQEGR